MAGSGANLTLGRHPRATTWKSPCRVDGDLRRAIIRATGWLARIPAFAGMTVWGEWCSQRDDNGGACQARAGMTG